MNTARAIDKRAYRGGREFMLNDPANGVAYPMSDADERFVFPTHPFVAKGKDLVLNGGFDADASWAKDAGWTIAGGVGVATSAAGNNTINQAISGLVSGRLYEVVYTVSGYSAGGVRVRVGQTAFGITRNANGTYTETIVCAGNTILSFQAQGTTTLNIDNVSVREVNIPSSVKSLGTQLLVDGDMGAADTSAWTAGNSATLLKQTGAPFGSQVLRVARNGSNNPYAGQVILTIGKRYRVTGFARSDGSASPQIYLTSGVSYTAPTQTNWHYFDFSVIATQTTFALMAATSTGTQYAEFADIRVVEDLPIFPGTRIMDGDMEVADTRWWTAVNAPTMTKQTGTPFDGSQVLRIARNTTNHPYAYQSVLIPGKRYRVRGRARSDGSATPRAGDETTPSIFFGTTSTSWQAFDFVFVASSARFIVGAFTTTGNQYVEFDDVVVEEVSPLTGVATNVVFGAPAPSPQARKKAVFAGNGYIDIYNPVLNSIPFQDKGTLVIVGYGERGGANEWFTLIGRTISADYFHITNETSRPGFRRTKNGDELISVNVAYPRQVRGIHVYSMSWDSDTGLLEAYVDGMLHGTATGINPFVTGTALGSTTCVIGARNNSGSGGLNGEIELAQILTERKPYVWHRELARRFGCAR